MKPQKIIKQLLQITSQVVISILIASVNLTAQMPAAITIDPPDATAYDEITLTFDPEYACFESGSLEGLPFIAMHSGVTTSDGYAWQYVIEFNSTGVNGQDPVLQPTGDGRFSITFCPYNFYGFPDGTEITQICAVFNNGTNWNQDGRDFLTGSDLCFDFYIPLSNGKSRWEFQNPWPVADDFKQVCFVDQSHGWACTETGYLLHTNDGGENWSIQPTGTGHNINCLCFLDQLNGWALNSLNCYNNQVLYTSNGGETWEIQKVINHYMNAGPMYIQFVDQNSGWVAGNDQSYRTVDGGSTWDTTSFPSEIAQMQFTDPDHGWVLANWGNTLYSTNDGGISWSINVTIGPYVPITMYFLSNEVGWILCTDYTSDILFKTSDGGLNWTSLGQLSPYYYVDKIFFVDELNGWLLHSWGGGIFHTYDGGTYWEEQSFPFNTNVRDLCFTDPNHGWAVGYGGAILFTDNAGNDWAYQSGIAGSGLYDIVFLNQYRGFAVGYDGNILVTENSGETWAIQNNASYEGLTGITFVDEYNGWISQINGGLLHTSDGGFTWQNQSIGQYSNINAVCFADPLNGWVTTGWLAGEIYHTNDGGNNWTAQQIGVSVQLNDIFFINTQKGWAAGESGTIIQTTNGGNAWEPVFSFPSVTINSLFFKDELTGYVAGSSNYSSGIIMKTNDGGQDWNMTATSLPLNDIFFLDDFTGYAVGELGSVLYTIDAGETWISEKSITTNSLYGVYFVDEDHGWAVGSNNVILHYIPENVVKIPEVKVPKQKLPFVKFYPNPVIGQATVEYITQNDSQVSLSLYNLNGQLIKTMICGKQEPGNHQMSINLEDYKPGMYYLQIHAGKQISVQKIIKTD